MSAKTSDHDGDDVQMSDAQEILGSNSPAPAAEAKPHPLPGSPLLISDSSAQDDDDDSEDSESLADGVEVISVSSRENSVAVDDDGTIDLVVVKSESPSEGEPRDSIVDTKPASSASQAGPSTSTAAPNAINILKPKSKSAKVKASHPRSPSPTPPPPPVPMQTVRLEFPLGGPDNYEVHISHMARDSGQRPPTPVRVIKPDLSDSESEKEKDAGEKEADEGKPAAKARKKRKSAAAEYYDVHDPFIDDSELALDERTYFAQTKQQGFYVSSGEVALLKDKTPRKPKPKSRKSNANPDVASISAAGPSALGTKDSPIALGEDGEDQDGNDEDEGGKVGQKRKRYSTVWENGKKRRVVNQNDFHPDVQQAVEELKLARDKEDWNTKGKFPPGIKPLLAQVSLKAVELDEYDEHFFNLMATLFPYNKFTITKLIKRTIFQDHVNLLNQRQAVLLEQLAVVTKEGFVRAQEEHEKTVTQWETRQAKLKEVGEPAFGAPGLVAPTISISARQSTDAEEADGMDVDAPPASQMENSTASAVGGLSAAGKGDKGEPHPPSKKYRMTDQIKGIVWQLVTLSNECCRLENEKNLLEGTAAQVSEQGLRKNLYQKIVAAFPEGWMSSGQISRDVSAMKKKLEKEAMDNEA